MRYFRHELAFDYGIFSPPLRDYAELLLFFILLPAPNSNSVMSTGFVHHPPSAGTRSTSRSGIQAGVSVIVVSPASFLLGAHDVAGPRAQRIT